MLLFAAAPLLGACDDGAAAAASKPVYARPNVLLVTVDTLRADHLSSYGYPQPTTPFLDGLAGEGVRFEHAYSTSSWTVPSLVSLLTSTYPLRHGMGEGAGRQGTQWEVIPDDLTTLAETLQARGYRTFGLTANFGLPKERGFGRGFDFYECVGAENLEAADRVLTGWLPEMEEKGPWFLWLHLFDPHAPYLAREELAAVYPAGGERFAELEGQPADEYQKIGPRLDTARLDYVQALYGSEIRHVDEYLRDLFGRLPGAGEALFAFTADHGEEFQEHGSVGHGQNLFEESIRVPLIVRFPDRRLAGTVVDEPVSLLDVFPSLVAAVGGTPPADLAGQDLFAARSPERIVVSELRRRSSLRSCRGKRWKLVYDTAAPERGLLFDLHADPGERSNRFAGEPALVADLLAFCAAYERRNEERSLGGLTEITEEQLRALSAFGYADR